MQLGLGLEPMANDRCGGDRGVCGGFRDEGREGVMRSRIG